MKLRQASWKICCLFHNQLLEGPITWIYVGHIPIIADLDIDMFNLKNNWLEVLMIKKTYIKQFSIGPKLVN